MKIIPSESQKTVAITFLAEEMIFVFFGTNSPMATHCLDFSLVSGI